MPKYTYFTINYLPMIQKSRFDKLWIGLIAGLIIPPLTLTILYTVRFQGFSFEGMVKYMKVLDVFVKVISLCILPNLGMFYLFLQTNNYKAVRGVLLATLLFTIGIFIYYFA